MGGGADVWDGYGERLPGALPASRWEDHVRVVETASTPVSCVDLPCENAPTLVLLHGISAGWRWFAHLFPALSEHYRVIAVDLPGFGASQFSRRHVTFDGLGDSVVDLCDALDVDAPVVVGHSMGSLVGTRAAVRHPSRLGGLIITGGPILSLVHLVRRPVATFRRNPRSVATLVAESAMVGFPVPSSAARFVAESERLRRALLGGFVARPDLLDTEVVRATMHDLGAPATFPALVSAVTRDPGRDLEQVQCRTRILRGDGDALSPSGDVETFLSRVPSADEVRFAHTGHWPHIERPRRFVEEVHRFVSSDDVALGPDPSPRR
ncbi:alpha/beta fold hydrolase [Rhodococcoides corynebacterioides]|uniref:Alpha/beta hydrolase n=1 Tax=Rhodococcoides corynebacterioides TaxID=53972 RepID=A0ABS7P6Y4_9NOCA|nr:alpha/beta hydrolase [Rhodococcus corynebacterioides]MBY6368153.1 alpha/beta hydrolase [Rhodococcus corynebacterioides]MBY6409036.1 alpha/beta hydrolase [Rhodococcus corynebacterioides]